MDQFLDLSSLESTQQSLVAGEQDGTAGMSFSELFQHYLAPEVAKLPASYSSAPSTSTSLAPAATSEYPFDPTAYLPTLPGSPIGAFSPSSDNSGSNTARRYGASLSPISFPDLDLDLGGEGQAGVGDDWAIDPSFFGGGGVELAPVVEEQEEPVASTSTTLPAILPPLPLGAIDNQPAPAFVAQAQPQLKRHLSASVTGDESASSAEEEDDEDAFSDHSRATTTTTRSKRPVAKKVKSTTSGGKAKATPKTSVAAFATPTLHATSSKSTLAPVPEWTDKPDPEAYKKLNSKEKRQLRNKISARNFRHRRKEHLTTLEEEIHSRDTIISQLRDQVGVLRTENQDLRGEVTLLKQKWEEMLEKMTSLNGAGAVAGGSVVSAGLGLAQVGGQRLATTPAAVVVKQESSDEAAGGWALDSPASVEASVSTPVNAPTRRTGTRGSNGIAKPNLSKDVAPGLGRRTGSWTTAGGMGGFTSVHTTLMPEFNLSNKPISSSPSTLFSGNFNPALNALSPSQLAQLPSLTSHVRTSTGLGSSTAVEKSNAGTFDDFFETNPFWLRSEHVEEYRASLYGKLAHNAAGQVAQSKGATLPSGWRPAFFSSPPPPYSEKPKADTASDLMASQHSPSPTNAYLASLATQTLFSRMAGAFVDAFAGTPERGAKFNGEKVAAVLAGTSRLQVVPNGPSPAADEVDGLGLGLGALNLESSPRSGDLSLGAAVGAGGACSFEEMRRRWRGGKSWEEAMGGKEGSA